LPHNHRPAAILPAWQSDPVYDFQIKPEGTSLKEVSMKTAGDIVKDKKSDIIAISSDRSVHEACRLMTENKIGALLIKKNNELVGIWTERDLLHHITVPDFDPKTARVEDYMSAPLKTVSHETHLHKLADMFLGLFLRHLLVEKEGEYLGLVSIGDVLRASLLEKENQFKELNTFVSWEYYENWKWGREKKRAKRPKT
jgi:signal-transduction protein with cAMP-binding, CBS, and nucleotidyltransferase domain